MEHLNLKNENKFNPSKDINIQPFQLLYYTQLEYKTTLEVLHFNLAALSIIWSQNMEFPTVSIRVTITQGPE